MSFSNQDTLIEYTADGNTDTFAINFHILENSDDISATVYDVTDPYAPVEEVIPFSIDHTNYPASEVVFISNPASGRLVHISRATPSGQYSNFAKGSFPAEAVEETFDLLAMTSQEIRAVLDRTLQNSIGGIPVTIEDIQDAASIAAEAENRLDQHELDISDNADAISDIYTTQLPSKEGTITASTPDKYYRGDKSFVDLNPAVIASLLTGYAAEAGGVIATDTILEAIQKVDGNNIAINNALVSKEDPWTVNSEVLSGTYSVGHREIHIAKSAVQTINLPAPQVNLMCKVKMAGTYANVTVQSVAGIDGFGVSYTLSSSYESISLVSDGTTWYII